ncbi:MAG: PAS domain S-box protein [Oceanospirillaceae bacterium]|nr:PAS domain S-box protein [Oceanospirillaceae bacterium]
MKLNMPITDREVLLPEGQDLVTKTDLKGKIVYANPAFVSISGYSLEELVGKNHNVVRHPDMPVAAFKNLWDTLKLGRPWSQCVKNRCKNGDYYWVKANITPVFKNGEVDGFMSVRTKVSTEEIDRAEALYEALSSKKTQFVDPQSIRIKNIDKIFRRYSSLSLVAMVIITGFIYLLSLPAEMLMIGPLISLLFLCASNLYQIKKQVSDPIEELKKAMVEISEGNYLTDFALDEPGEIGSIKRAINMLGVKIGFEVNDAQQQAQENIRIKVALDNVNSSVMLADNDGKIIYLNSAVEKMMKIAETQVATHIKGFKSVNLLGSNFSAFHTNPDHQRNLLRTLTKTYEISIMLGDVTMLLTANPVIDAGGTRLGTVIEWKNLTGQLSAENEVQKLIENASKGDFEQRLDEAKYSGFMQVMATSINTMMDSVTLPIKEAKRVLESVARGDLTQQMEGSFQGEFEQLNLAVNTSIQNLSNMVGKIRNAGDNIKTGASEIATGNSTLSARTESQAATLEETAASMEEMTGTVKSNADNAEEAKRLSEKAQILAEQGGEVSKKVISSMSDISQSASKIAEIITVIDEIAFQTNLLALNAAVEAARAGDQGRGFAVVASEVRILAQRSAKAAKEIKLLIQESTEKVAEGNTFVIESGQALTDIIESIKNVTELAGEIASSSREQASGIEQVNIAVTKMDEAVQQNAALVEEVSAASVSLDGEAVQLKTLVREFSVNNSAEIERRDIVNDGLTNSESTEGQARHRKAASGQNKVYQIAESKEEWREF